MLVGAQPTRARRGWEPVSANKFQFSQVITRGAVSERSTRGSNCKFAPWKGSRGIAR